VADIFVSYTSSDRDWAFWIGKELENLGHTPHIHEWEIPAGGDIPKWMDERFDGADHVLCVISKAYLAAQYSGWERRAAVWAAQSKKPNFTLPVFVDECEAPSLLAPFKRCDLFGLSEDDAREKLAAYLAPAIRPIGPLRFPGRAEAARLSHPLEPVSFPGGVAPPTAASPLRPPSDKSLAPSLPATHIAPHERKAPNGADEAPAKIKDPQRVEASPPKQSSRQPVLPNTPYAEQLSGDQQIGCDSSRWQRIQITMTGKGRNRSLSFSVSSGSKHIEAQTVVANLDLVAPLVRRVHRTGTNDDSSTSPGRALFELLWPAALKDDAEQERSRLLILDARSAGFPWEMLDDRRPWMSDLAYLRPPAVRAGMVRQLLGIRVWEDVVTRGTPKALVIGNPRGAPTNMADLPKAEEEAKDIAAALESSFTVTLLAGVAAGPEQITRRLFTEAWDIIHVSAPSIWNQRLVGPDGKRESKPRTGIVLGGGVVLDASALAKIPVRPKIAFINCCYLGVGPINLDGRPEFAANSTIELLRLGARCVIAAGWAIDDDVAAEFGKTFYREMLNGRTFGQATWLARQAAYQANPNSSTFGAYQCYGDPDYRLRASGR
jgi:hypothetical protein